MSGVAIWVLVASSLAVVMARRRTSAILLVALQSLILGVYALTKGPYGSALAIVATILIAKALLLPWLLLVTVRRAPKQRLLGGESPALVRLIVALLVGFAIEQLIPRLGLTEAVIEHAAVGMLGLGMAVALLRRAVIFQALGFLIAENGVYLAGLSLRGGLPALIELGLAFDLVVIVSVAAAFAAKIHEQLGSGDTSLLEQLRD
jgi:hydrogenase-4 component E